MVGSKRLPRSSNDRRIYTISGGKHQHSPTRKWAELEFVQAVLLMKIFDGFSTAVCLGHEKPFVRDVNKNLATILITSTGRSRPKRSRVPCASYVIAKNKFSVVSVVPCSGDFDVMCVVWPRSNEDTRNAHEAKNPKA